MKAIVYHYFSYEQLQMNTSGMGGFVVKDLSVELTPHTANFVDYIFVKHLHMH